MNPTIAHEATTKIKKEVEKLHDTDTVGSIYQVEIGRKQNDKDKNKHAATITIQYKTYTDEQKFLNAVQTVRNSNDKWYWTTPNKNPILRCGGCNTLKLQKNTENSKKRFYTCKNCGAKNHTTQTTL